jgi:hypothetical protein
MRKAKGGSKKRQPKRPHFIPEWAEKTGFEDQADLVEALGADKSVVSRWYSGTSPGEDWQLKLCALFGYPNQPDIIFQHPNTVWLSRFMQNRENDEIERIKTALEASFPPRPKAPR